MHDSIITEVKVHEVQVIGNTALRVVTERESHFQCGRPSPFRPPCPTPPVFAVQGTTGLNLRQMEPEVLFCLGCARQAGWLSERGSS